MKKIRFVSWNVNSVRMRLALLARLTQRYAPDVVCLQETKVTDDLFPHAPLAAMGYVHRHVAGMKSYNGVAILSRLPFEETHIYDCAGRDDKRHISVRVAGIRCDNLYLPAGGDIPDVTLNERFAYKFEYLAKLAPILTQASQGASIALGDFNIAPLPCDVWNHKALLKVVCHTPEEVAALEALREAGRWVDILRVMAPPPVHLYSWWSYRAPDFQKNDRGRRLDIIWLARALASRARGGALLREVRAWDNPSDHVPIFVDIAC